MRISINEDSILDEQGRILMLRGVNLGGSSKVPAIPDGSTYLTQGFFDHRNVSFIGRPFPLEQADEHYHRLRSWGFNTLRFLITWEAVEHAGPGIYDQEYLDYLRKIVAKAGEWDFLVFIDLHQDVWSRFTGGDGAPGWTLEAVGLDMTQFKETGAALVQQTNGAPLPKMIWPTNACKLAAATMFTLFFGGNDFAPSVRIESVPVQDYLQTHYFAVIRTVAEKLHGLECVIGYDVFNEPQKGYIGLRDLREEFDTLKFGPMPTPWQTMQLGSGFPQRVPCSPTALIDFPIKKHLVLNRERLSAWLPGKTCIWRENGVWDVAADGQPRLLRPNHFARVGDQSVDFSRDYLIPFTQKFAETIHSVDPEAFIFIENEVESASPLWHIPGHHFVYAPHWYDGVPIVVHKYFSWFGAEMRTRKMVFGRKRINRSYVSQLKEIRDEGMEKLGNIPVLIGETGIPFDIDKKQAFRTGDFTHQTQAMDRTLQALESTLLSYTLWNYNAYNNNQHGDNWNEEDFSIFSPDQRSDPADLNSGGRALSAVVRPSPLATTGKPQQISFDCLTGNFMYTFKQGSFDPHITTLLYVPLLQYPTSMEIQISDGAYTYSTDTQVLEYSAGDLETHTIKISRK